MAQTTDVPRHLTTAELEAGLDEVRRSPADGGRVEMIVARPAEDERVVLEVGHLTLDGGLAGDDWYERGSSRTDDGKGHPEMQVAVINRRFLDHVAGGQDRWPLAGDQLVVDLDLSTDNLEPGQRLQIGSAMLEVTVVPHLGCAKFIERFGRDAMVFANGPVGRALRLRGIYLKVVEAGTIEVGDTITKL